MTRSAFDPAFEALPPVLPIFPLSGALVLPRGQLPLNIFEPRYLAMVRDTLGGARMIGMIQPCAACADKPPVYEIGGQPPVYEIGCAGRITAFSETEDGRFLITLKGIIRFQVAEELAPESGYRRVVPDFTPFRADLDADETEIDRGALLCALGRYLESNGMEGDWTAIKEAPDEPLVTWLAMGCPFDPSEKQALLEAATLAERAETMLAILRMACVGDGGRAARH